VRALTAKKSNWWRPWRIGAAAIAAICIAIVAFLFRFNTLGGSLGGFDNDHFIYLIRTDMLLRGEQPLRDFVDAELRGAWPALTYAVSAWAQQIGGKTLLPEAYLTVGSLAFGHALVFLLALTLSKRWWVAFLAAAAAIATVPKLYNYPKVLALAVGVWAIRAVIIKPNTLRLAVAAFVTAAAVLFRHDLGIYPAAGLTAGLVAANAGQLTVAVRYVATYAGLTAAFLLPSLAWVQIYEGIPDYLRASRDSVVVERARTELTLLPFDFSSPLAFDNLERATYYAFWLIPAIAAVALAMRLTSWKGTQMPAQDRATGVALLVMAVLANMSFLRANLAERFGDSAVAVVLLAAWIAGIAMFWTSAAMQRVTVLAPAAALVLVCVAAYVLSDVRRELDTSGLSDSWDKTSRRYHAVHGELGRLPPAAWTDADSVGTLHAAHYLAECTGEDDPVLVVGPIHEVPVFAGRPFAAGQAMFKLSLYTSEAFQRRAIARLQTQRASVILADAEVFDGFSSDYPLVASYVSSHYREAGVIDIDDEPRIRVFADTSRQPVRSHTGFGLPCFR
jgi:hypothetical protein